ncbi:Uncharacterized membrane protein HdeD, DUF308 family [Pseudobutyrivibrio ruminis]|uniref:Uncharacterized membrane protein HdeD, DUF308 family n=2 Tax=Pseudobutyrivibrio ruminis TaxID=46206 RepID=A0A1H7L7E6_9FIRM|nr:DUF308 domain-containing protein [Pseudobutyrivibrio ruminis]SEK94973.1 Uncharacterized membrane protein HdeD, DUF308 family [Pseudobutyrivibrio ruminis]SOC06338.1 Uncharacterized membrane protein HdeD, DUF308 family [Pseudobutyrivibrio ruminis DSM 9787]
MKEKIKSLRLNITISALISVIIGIMLLIFPEKSLITISRVIACIIILAGVSVIISQIYEFGMNALGIVIGAILAIIGVWIFRAPGSIVSIIPIAIGVILAVHGVQDLGMAIEATKAHAPRTWLAFLIAVLNIILGVVCIAAAFKVVEVTVQIIGIMLIYDGLTDFGIVHKVRKATGSVVDGTITREEDI